MNSLPVGQTDGPPTGTSGLAQAPAAHLAGHETIAGLVNRTVDLGRPGRGEDGSEHADFLSLAGGFRRFVW
jgi:hypothetical protein